MITDKQWMEKSGNGITYTFIEWGEEKYRVMRFDSCGCEGWLNVNDPNDIAFLGCYQHMLRLLRHSMAKDNPHMCLIADRPSGKKL